MAGLMPFIVGHSGDKSTAEEQNHVICLNYVSLVSVCMRKKAYMIFYFFFANNAE